jgi:LmbE family N-acetylglucosaminyl deacetylase
VLCQSPVRNLARIYASHPDHLASGEAALCAVYPDARNPFTFTELLAEEGLDAWTVPEVWLMGGPDADHAVDVTDQVERKLAALACHASQHQDPTAIGTRVRGWLAMVGEHFNLGAGRLGEAFRIVDTR